MEQGGIPGGTSTSKSGVSLLGREQDAIRVGVLYPVKAVGGILSCKFHLRGDPPAKGQL